jgi:hypothetical protein
MSSHVPAANAINGAAPGSSAIPFATPRFSNFSFMKVALRFGFSNPLQPIPMLSIASVIDL